MTDDELERLSQVLDDLAAGRDPRFALSADEASLAETAVWLKSGISAGAAPRAEFVARLGEQLATVRETLPAPEAAQPQSSVVPHPGPTRRGLLGRLATGAAGLILGAGAGAPIGATVSAATAYEQGKRDGYRQESSEPYRTPLAPPDRGQWLDTGQALAGLAAGEAVRFHVGALEGFLVHPADGGPVYAVSAACTHMGCLLTWLAGQRTFLCPCHGARYHASGAVQSGIARHPLPRLRVRADAGGRLFIWGVAEHPAITAPFPYAGP